MPSQLRSGTTHQRQGGCLCAPVSSHLLANWPHLKDGNVLVGGRMISDLAFAFRGAHHCIVMIQEPTCLELHLPHIGRGAVAPSRQVDTDTRTDRGSQCRRTCTHIRAYCAHVPRRGCSRACCRRRTARSATWRVWHLRIQGRGPRGQTGTPPWTTGGPLAHRCNQHSHHSMEV